MPETEAERGAPEALPYPGLRPFEPQESDRFYGRDRDARLLTGKILSGRATILYARSGLGKSSLLRAKVIPRLEERHAAVVYFDAWAQENPLAQLMDLLARLRPDGAPDFKPEDNSTLSGRVEGISKALNRTVILVLDQFEEFLVHYAADLDPVRAEVAALVKATEIDAAVVLSLREEFLAALEPLRASLPNLFQSTYRLDHLGEDALLNAILQPPAQFGGTCEPDLARRLIQDLQRRNAPVATIVSTGLWKRPIGRLRGRNAGDVPTPQPVDAAASSSGMASAGIVELPMLQLVCFQLWKRAINGQMTLDLYTQLGGLTRILHNYVEQVMPLAWREQKLAARLLGDLAPLSGLKRAYTVDDLAANAGVPGANVEAVLETLHKASLLRSREYGKAPLYELFHDAFIPILREWRSRVQRRERKLRNALKFTAAAAIIVAIGGSAMIVENRADAGRTARAIAEAGRRESRKEAERQRQLAELAETERQKLVAWQTGDIVRELGSMTAEDRKRAAPGRFDVLTYYVLSRRTEGDRMEKLRKLLMESEALLPPGYATQTYGRSRPGAPAPQLTLEYPAGHNLDEPSFTTEWQTLADAVAIDFGIPVSERIRFVQAEDLSGDKLRLKAGDQEVVFPFAVSAGQYMITTTPSKLARSPAREFIELFDKDWRRWKPRDWNDYRLVPRWSLPVWKAAGVTAGDSSAIAALLSMLELLDHPGPLFPPGAVNSLLEYAARTYPDTVREARAARGSALGADLAAKVAKNRAALLALPQILDDLAAQPVAPERATASVDARRAPFQQAQQSAPYVPTSQRLHGAWPAQPGTATEAVPRLRGDSRGAFATSVAQLPQYHPLVVYVSSELSAELFPGGVIPKALDDRLQGIRDGMYRKYGFVTPQIWFSQPSEDHPVKRGCIRISIASASGMGNEGDIELGRDRHREELLNELQFAIEENAPQWITAESTAEAVARLQPKTREWIESRYSLTDMKRLLRGAATMGPGSANARYAPWLLASMVFWDSVASPRDATVLERLLSPLMRRGTAQPEVVLGIRDGVVALVADDAAKASDLFRAAAGHDSDSSAAAAAFSREWDRQRLPVWLRAYRREHVTPDSTPKRYERLDLEDFRSALRTEQDPQTLRELTIVLLGSGVLKDPGAERALVRSAGSPANWRPQDARWLASRYFKSYTPLAANSEEDRHFASARALMMSAIQRLDYPGAASAFSGIADIAQNSETSNWAWKLLGELAAARPANSAENLEVELAWRLCREVRRDRLSLALKAIEHHESLLAAANLPASGLAAQKLNIDFVRANVGAGLARLGEGPYAGLEPRLRELADSSHTGIRVEAQLLLAKVLAESEEYDRALQASLEGRRRWPDEAAFAGAELSVYMRQGATVRVSAAGAGAFLQARSFDTANGGKSWLLVAALGAVLTQSADWRKIASAFLATDHEYRDYVLMLAQGLAGRDQWPELEASIRRRLQGIDPSSWPARLRNGDASAWRETLLWNLNDDAAAFRLLAKLENEESWAKSEFAELSDPRAGQLCEAWFYEAMRARARGRMGRMRECLESCLRTRYKSYYEYAMAQFLLTTQTKSATNQ